MDKTSLVSKLATGEHPLVAADEIGFFIADGFENRSLLLRDGYLLHSEVVRLVRIACLQPAWCHRVGISTLFAILNQRLLARFFRDDVAFEMLAHWGEQALHLNQERRPHEIIDRYREFMEPSNIQCLERLRELRATYNQLSDDEGPYPIEEFPFHYYSPEEMLLAPEDYAELLEERPTSEVEDILVASAHIELHP